MVFKLFSIRESVYKFKIVCEKLGMPSNNFMFLL